MITYKYSALDENNNIVKGKIQAVDENEARQILMSDKKKIIRIQAELLSESILGKSQKRISTQDIAHFCRQLSIITKSGISLLKGLLMIRNQTTDKKIKQLSENIYTNIQKGYSVSDAFKNSGYRLPLLLINMVQIGEITGNMDEIFKRLNEYFQKESNTRKKIISSLIYPSVLVCVSIGVIGLFLFKILPDMAGVIKEAGGQLPTFTQYLMSFSQFLLDNGIFVLLGLLLLFGILIWGIPQKVKTKVKNHILFKFPLLKSITKDFITARFVRTMGILVNTGLPMLVILETLEHSIGNTIVSKKIHEVKDRVNKGDSLSDSLERMRFFDPMVTNIISIGEETGTLGDALLDLAEYYDEKFDSGVTKLVSLIEPIFTLGMGAVIGGIVLSIMLPMFNMIGSFSHMGE